MAPRDSISARLKKLRTKGAKGYADFIKEGDSDGHIPCWGAITERFEATFKTDKRRLEILDELLKEGDPRPLLLFLHISEDRPALLQALCEQAALLPVSAQRSLIAIPKAEPFIEANLKQFSSAARAVWANGEATLKKERQHSAARIGELMAFRYFVPDSFDPREEPEHLKAASPSDPLSPTKPQEKP